jgi:hypothetical protein
MINPDGTVLPTTIYSSPSSVGLAGAFYHFWLAERGDLYRPDTQQTSAPFLPLPQGIPTPPGLPNGAVLKGETRLVTMFARNGQITTTDTPISAFNALFLDANGNYNPNNPYIPAQQGVQGGSQ